MEFLKQNISCTTGFLETVSIFTTITSFQAENKLYAKALNNWLQSKKRREKFSELGENECKEN